MKSESDQRPTKSSVKTAVHRKSKERTHLGDKESETVSESRKRRERDQSPENAHDSESDKFSKRLRNSPSPPNSVRSLEANHGSYYGQGQCEIFLDGKVPLCTLLVQGH